MKIAIQILILLALSLILLTIYEVNIKDLTVVNRGTYIYNSLSEFDLNCIEQ